VKNRFAEKHRLRPYAMVLLATAVGTWNLSRPSAQSSVETIAFFFAGSRVGTSTYRTLPNGRFESTSAEIVENMIVTSKLTGTITDGLLTEYELVTNHGGSEVKVTAKEGKAQVTREGKTREVDFKPTRAAFANEHPIVAETMIRALDRNRAGPQHIDLLLLAVATRMMTATHTIYHDQKRPSALRLRRLK
jgi:hypothetical protein